jgi:hypothetical protein
MNHLLRPIFFASLLLTALSCGTPTDPDSGSATITVSGVVVNDATNNALPDAIVQISVGTKTDFQVTDANGAYSFDVKVDSLVTLNFQAVKEGFVARTQQAFGVPGRNITMPDFRLAAVTSGGGTDPGTDPVGTGTGSAFSIQLQSISHPSIQVLATGGNEQSVLTVVVKDSLGRAIAEDKAVDVTFSFGARPNGGEGLQPATVRTDRSGLARTVLKAGTVSGVVQLIATVTLPGGAILRTQPVSVIIHSGLPDAAHFSMSTQQRNVPGCVRYGVSNLMTAYVGDRYGNNVPANTPIYFTTDGGIIGGSSATGANGTATTTLLTAAPCPTHPTLGPGFATVRARTADVNNNTIETSNVVLFSDASTLTVSPQVVNVPDGGSQSFVMTIDDINGNPLAPGTTITVTAEGEGITVLGDVSKTMPDTQGRGPGLTEFRFTLEDVDGTVNLQKAVEVRIDIISPNGNIAARINGSSFKILPKN